MRVKFIVPPALWESFCLGKPVLIDMASGARGLLADCAKGEVDIKHEYDSAKPGHVYITLKVRRKANARKSKKSKKS